MFKRNTIKTPSSKTIKVQFDDFDKNIEPTTNPFLKDSDYPKVSYNFKVKNGFLEDGYGVRDLMLPYDENDRTEHKAITENKELIAVWGFNWFDYTTLNNDTFIFVVDKDYNVYYIYEYFYPEMFFETGLQFTSLPVYEEYRVQDFNMLIFSSATDDLTLYGGGTKIYKYPTVPKFASCCVHENTFYAIQLEDCCKLMWTKDLDAFALDTTEFQEYLFSGGEGGRLRKLFSFNDQVYLFRDMGIVKLYPFSTESPLSVTHVYYSSSFIFPQTTQRCGEYIVFLTREGIHLFNGNTVSKVELEAFDLVDTSRYETFVSASQNGKFFLACKMNFDDDEVVGCEGSENGYRNNAVLVFDVESGDVEIMRGVDISDFAPIESNIMSKLLCTFNNDNIARLGEFTRDGEIFGEGTVKKWTSVPTDFGYRENIKVVKSISLFSKADCEVTIKSESESATLKIKGSDNLQKKRTKVRGNVFEVSFKSTLNGQKISMPELEVEVLL